MNAPNVTRVAVVTGSRAEFGLLRTIMRAIQAHPALELQTIVTGVHLLEPERTRDEVAAEFEIHSEVPMQVADETGRAADVAALGRGVAGLGDAFERLRPDVVMVLGDRVEAMAGALAGAVGGRLVAHVHGGDRAEGVADEAMRHAITKLAHLHFPATAASAERIVRLGENPAWVLVVGSPAIDELPHVPPLDDASLRDLGANPAEPMAVVLHHPAGLDDEIERATMAAVLEAVESHSSLGLRVILAPNRDPGRAGVLAAIGARPVVHHLPRARFVGLLKRAAVLVGNSSAGLIEAAAIGLPAVNVGPRQNGRERAANVVDVQTASVDSLSDAITQALRLRPNPTAHPYGDGRTGQRIAATLADLPRHRPSLRKRNVY